jgi:hypothetical protein
MLGNSCFFIKSVTVRPSSPSTFQCVRHLSEYVSRSKAHSAREKAETRWERCPESCQNSEKKNFCGGRCHTRIWCWAASKSCLPSAFKILMKHPSRNKKKTKHAERNRDKDVYTVQGKGTLSIQIQNSNGGKV